MVEKACRRCRYITDENVCPNCKSTDLSEDFSGLVIIFDPKNSIVAKSMKIEAKGRYAIKVR